jgi:hypothetical protein
VEQESAQGQVKASRSRAGGGGRAAADGRVRAGQGDGGRRCADGRGVVWGAAGRCVRCLSSNRLWSCR